MEKIDTNINTIIDKIKKMNGNSCDITTRIFKLKNTNVAYIYLESVSSDDKISDFLSRSISTDIKYKKINIFENIFNYLTNTIPSSKMQVIETYEDLFYFLASGFTCIIIDGYNKAITFETKASLDRGVTESTSEQIVRGPKDSFTENHMINVGLIRKRIKDPNLFITEKIVGRRTKTKVSLAYINDIVKEEHIKQIKNILNNIDVDGVLDAGNIREYLNRNQKSSFPKILSTERPDIACSSLLDGKIVLMVENSPIMLIMPTVLVDFIHSPEDYYQNPINVSITRILRFISFFLTILTPAIYIALITFNHEIIPDKLLVSLNTQRQGVPFPTAIEIIILSITFEILRESDIRLPNSMGTAVSIVGALVLGDAAVAAGIVSPITVIVVAFTSISGLLFSDIDMVNGIRVWRALFILMSALMGLIGIVIAGLILLIHLCSLESLGTPYLAPFSPFNMQSQKNSLLLFPKYKIKLRDKYLNIKDATKVGGHDEK